MGWSGNMGKAYANRKKKEDRPANDFYATPKCLTWELLNAEDNSGVRIFDRNENNIILDPCCGKYAISSILKDNGLNVVEKDLIYGEDFLTSDLTHYDKIVMNPPFNLFNDFVKKAKLQAGKVYCIGKMDYFCTHNRNVENLWEHLEWVLPFDRKVAYDKPFREDGKVEVGMLNSCWFVWNKFYNGYPKIKVIDVDKYVLRKGE